jgi:hypothetical protein
MRYEKYGVGLEPSIMLLGVIWFKTREHELTTLLKPICFMVRTPV